MATLASNKLKLTKKLTADEYATYSDAGFATTRLNLFATYPSGEVIIINEGNTASTDWQITTEGDDYIMRYHNSVSNYEFFANTATYEGTWRFEFKLANATYTNVYSTIGSAVVRKLIDTGVDDSATATEAEIVYM